MKPFSYDACPLNDDGTRRAVTRDGREVVLLSDKGPRDFYQIAGFYIDRDGDRHPTWWSASGAWHKYQCGSDLLIPTTKRTIFAVFHPGGIASWFETEDQAVRNERENIGEHWTPKVYAVEVEE